MSKIEIATVNTPLNSHEFQAQINRNFEKVSEALDNQLQRTAQEGVVNSMEQELDMGGNRIINLAKAVDPSDAMRKKEFDEQIANIEQWAQEAKDSAASAAEDADDAEEARRVAVSAAQSAQEHERQTQDLFDILMADDSIPVVAENIEDVKTVATDIDSVKTNADNIEDIKAVFDIAKRIAYGNIGDIRATYKNTVPEGCRFADGTTVAKEDYPELFELLEAGTIASHTVADWTTLKNTYGVTGSFGFDKGVGSTIAYLPLLTEAFVEATNNTPHRINEAGLPNITGEAGNYGNGTGADYYSSGAMYVREYTGVVGESEDTQGVSSIYGIDASRSSSVYGKSDTVQPKSVMLRHYVVLTNSRQMILTVRPSVATKNALPTTGNINGDIRVVTNEGVAYVWARVSGTQWMWSSIGRVGTSGSSGFAEWGSVGGDITAQTDLQEALSKKLENTADHWTSFSLEGKAYGQHQIVVGGNGGFDDAYATAVGHGAQAYGEQASALGAYAYVGAKGAIQIGHGKNDEENTLKVGFSVTSPSAWTAADPNYVLLTSDGKIPIERLPDGIGGSVDLTGYLKNTATGSDSLALLGGTAPGNGSFAIGSGSQTSSTYSGCIAFGGSSKADGNGAICLGGGSWAAGAFSTIVGGSSFAWGKYGIAIGHGATSNQDYSIQLGKGTNNASNTLSVGLSDSLNVQLLDANGNIPAERLTNAPGLKNTTNTDLASLVVVADGTTVVQSGGVSQVAFGCNTVTLAGSGATAFGGYTRARGNKATALGFGAKVDAAFAIQIGNGVNSTASTMSVALSDSLNVQLLDANGNIPGERMSLQGTTAPDTTTVGSIGQFYVDTATSTGYMCVGVSGSTYTWKQITV